jgi:outer membrane murein-binding lipoprotein Lpp
MRYLIVLIILFSLITAGCNNNNKIDFNQLVDSLVNAVKTMKSKELVTTTATSSSSSDGMINFRLDT